MHGSSTSAKRRARNERPSTASASSSRGPGQKSARAAEPASPGARRARTQAERAPASTAIKAATPARASASKAARGALAKATPAREEGASKPAAKAKVVRSRKPAAANAAAPIRAAREIELPKPTPRSLTRNLHSSPPPPPALREWLQTKRSMQEYLVQRVEVEHVDKAARLLLAGDSGREPNPIVVDAVAAILERIAEHACALEFGISGDQRVDAAEALEDVQALLVKLAEPRRADFVALVLDYAARLRRLGATPDAAEAQAIVQAFVIASTRFDRAFRRLEETYVREQLASLAATRAAPKGSALVQVAGAMSARVGAFSDRNAKRAAAAFEKARRAAALRP